MKFLASILFSITFFFGLTLSELRTDFENAAKSAKNVDILYNKLDDYTGNNQTIVAYKGASVILKARFVKDKATKKKYFTDGATLINDAVKNDSKDVENRLIRLIIQENIPKFIKYNQNIQQDKQFIVDNYNSAPKEVQTLVKTYAKKYNTFTPQQLKKLK
ncbi:hypothetical protein SAMN05421738_108106 [Algoriella xinjiangensis]|uniref:Uncharacterized protein n=1 Tax=Algoriella xinjiangensis TaxID=684065 RepID=A0A1I4X6S2_9FLAO|nr:hypothetical protein [Algoriella xinjiangensis]SFN21405.1 hypothetical protein SAMN05421738_108106 [Algoriella xinjiangensis]VDH14754.1 Uncharacterised protein [Algoriella xinjiangensis]